MEYAEFWILETAVDAHVHFRHVDGPRRFLEGQWNKPWHALPRSALLDTFERLLRAGEIVVLDENRDVVTLSRAELDYEIETGERGPNAKAYGLTPEGGTRWERFAKADWSRYHSFKWNIEEEDVLELVATTCEAVERACRYAIPWNKLRVFPETVERRTLHPWSATYWKTFQVGYSVQFKCEYINDEDEVMDYFFPGWSDAEVRDAYSEIHRDYDYFHEWYTKHPDTPRMGRI